jgi:hypothetical protein
VIELDRSSEIRACVVTILLLLLLSSVSSIVVYASNLSSSSSSPSTSSKGCAEGWGYYVDDPDPVCEPLDKIGQGPSQDVGFCAALGCPYNPPNLPSPSPDIEDGDQEIEEGKVEGNSVSEEQKQK